MAVFAVILGVYGTKLMRTGYLKRTPVLQWAYTWIYLAIPVGAALMLVRLPPIGPSTRPASAAPGRGASPPLWRSRYDR